MKILTEILTVSNIILFITCAILLYIVIKNNAIKNFLGAFNNREEGDSGRKWTAFGFSVLGAYVHYQGFRSRALNTSLQNGVEVINYHSYIDHDNITTVLLMDICVTLLALALIKTDDIPFLNKGSKTIIEQENSTEKSKTTTTEEVK